jgi:NTP pyrophosphatase (non-canonical NTP hydrolase)
MNEHAQLVRDLKKPAMDIHRTITPLDLDLIHMIMGISGEAGELLDAVKKATIYKKSIDISNVVEELGDLEFYLEGLRQILNITREDVLAQNISKLRIRYGQKYSDKAAQDRVDKAKVLDQAIECDLDLPDKWCTMEADIVMTTNDVPNSLPNG